MGWTFAISPQSRPRSGGSGSWSDFAFGPCGGGGLGKVRISFLNLQPADWRRVLEVNVLGMVHVAQAVAKGMMERKKGRWCLSVPLPANRFPDDPPYSASKAARYQLAQCGQDLAAHAIRE